MNERRYSVTAGGHRLEVIERGVRPAYGPSMVFLHEGLGSAEQWRDVPDRLVEKTGWGALIYSRWGYGRSEPVRLPRPLTYMHEEGDITLPELLDACKVQSFVLVGHSDGGSIAIVHAGSDRLRPRGLRGLVLEAPHVFVEDVSVKSIEQARVAFERGPLREGLAKYHDDPDGAFRGWNEVWLDPDFRAWNIERYLPRIDVPVLVIQGADDPYGTIAQVDAIDRGVFPAGIERLILPECGHAPHRDQPEATIDAIAAFVNGVTR
jgi:pimeloyl-ACP methyl ester carboxylesterase